MTLLEPQVEGCVVDLLALPPNVTFVFFKLVYPTRQKKEKRGEQVKGWRGEEVKCHIVTIKR